MPEYATDVDVIDNIIFSHYIIVTFGRFSYYRSTDSEGSDHRRLKKGRRLQYH
jgi:hypothetical protein